MGSEKRYVEAKLTKCPKARLQVARDMRKGVGRDALVAAVMSDYG
jgi:hypothetical protein